MDGSGDEGRAESKLLEIIEGHGKISPFGAPLETWLTVAEVERMLGDLAEKGDLAIRVREGKLAHSF